MARHLYEKLNRKAATRNPDLRLDFDPMTVPYEQLHEVLRDPLTFAKRIERFSREVQPGIQVTGETIELGDGHFTNRYDLIVDTNDPLFSTRIISMPSATHARNLLRRDKKIKATVNGGFYFLADGKPSKVPSEPTFNLNIRGGKVLGLPATDTVGLLSVDGKLTAEVIRAQGKMRVGEKKIRWRGGQHIAHGDRSTESETYLLDQNAVLFNSSCCTLEYEVPGDNTSLRMVQEHLNKTPTRQDVTDVVVRTSPDGTLRVHSVLPGGGSDFFDGNFVLQMSNDVARDIKTGDEVEPTLLDNIEIYGIESAITVGPLVHHFLENEGHSVNADKSLGNSPFGRVRFARSVAYEDNDGKLHFTVFDAVPRSTYMKGITPHEIARLIPTDARWAVFLDGGQSSRITYENVQNDEVDIRSFGNKAYLRLHTADETSLGIMEPNQRYIGPGIGRPVPSYIAIEKYIDSSNRD
ncbi:phosphodiester glycosidase family protein [Patescibacteria group bacterium]|nr:phosphodiester glycosidase family protein [Patescibacteria group bacterium]